MAETNVNLEYSAIRLSLLDLNVVDNFVTFNYFFKNDVSAFNAHEPSYLYSRAAIDMLFQSQSTKCPRYCLNGNK